MDYAVLTLELPEPLAEAAAALLFAGGALGVETRDGADAPPGERPLAPGRARVTAWFTGGPERDAASAQVRAALGDAVGQAVSSACADEDWAETWKTHFPPLHIADRLWVLPPWEPPRPGLLVVIEPGMAFGTGGHATTALCLEALVDAVRPGASVLDLGCGSGILGIAAHRLGAGRVVLADNDPEAVAIARENCVRNGLPELIPTSAAVSELPGEFDVIVANILAGTLIELAAPITERRAPAGTLVLSGILAEQADDVVAAYTARGLSLRRRRARDEWVCLELA